MAVNPEDLGFDIPAPEKRGSAVTYVMQNTPEEETFREESFNVSEVEQAAKNSLDFLAALVMPTVFRYCFPVVFKAIWEWLLSFVHLRRDFSQLAIGLPRGFGKTMLMKIFIAYAVLFTGKRFILIICGTQAKANNILADVMAMLDESNVKAVFGDWKAGVETDRLDLKRFGFRGRNIVLMAAGANSDIRGITLENMRPDIILFDDIQSKDDADSEVVSERLETWMLGTAMKAKSPEGCLFIFIGNMYPTKHSLLRKLKRNPTWTKFIAGGLVQQADGRVESLWEELQPIEQLLREFENDLSSGHPEIFYSEVLNDENASVNRFISLENIPKNPYEFETQNQGNFIIIDPSNDKANSDSVSIGYFEIFDGKPVCKKIIDARLSPGDTIDETLKLCLQNGCRLVVVESTAYQYSHLYWFNRACKEKGISGITCADIYSGSISKNSRILTMFKGLTGNDPEQYLSNDVRAQVFTQITAFNPLKTTNVDGILDLLTYAMRVVAEYGEYILSGLTIEMQEYDAIPVLSSADNVCF
jgi:hypothetical protein